jgi:hypothetical protein
MIAVQLIVVYTNIANIPLHCWFNRIAGAQWQQLVMVYHVS